MDLIIIENYDLVPVSEHQMQYLKELEMSMPFDLVNLKQGKSKCNECGHIHDGHIISCTNQVPHYDEQRIPDAVLNRGPNRYKFDSYNYKHHWNSKELKVGDVRTEGKKGEDHYYEYHIRWVGNDNCKGKCHWDLQQAYNEQKAFFDIVSFAHDALICNNTYFQTPYNFDEFFQAFMKYHNAFPPEVVTKLNTALTLYNMAGQDDIRNGMNQIAEKMNAAGYCLSF